MSGLVSGGPAFEYVTLGFGVADKRFGGKQPASTAAI